MSGFMYRLGRMAGGTWRKGRWAWVSATGDRGEILQAEYDMGRDLVEAVLDETPLHPDRRLQHHVARCGEYLVSRLVRSDKRYSFKVLDAAQANAFALPGGFIFITSGLVQLCENNRDETSFVLGHEMGHIARGHAMDRMMTEFAMRTVGRALPQGRILRGKVVQLATTFAGKAYARHQEFEADAYGLRLLRSGGLDLSAAERLLERLESATDRDEQNIPLMEYLSTHPPTQDRITELGKLIRKWQRNGQ
jgi:predicted Zn-dependent protease